MVWSQYLLTSFHFWFQAINKVVDLVSNWVGIGLWIFLFIITLLLNDHVIIIFIKTSFIRFSIFFTSLLVLLVNQRSNDLVQNDQAWCLAWFRTFTICFSGKVCDYFQVLFLAKNVEEIFWFEHVLNDSTSIKIVFKTVFWSKRANKSNDCFLLSFLDLCLELWFKVRLNLCKQFVQYFRNWFLVHMLQEIIHYFWFFTENVWNQLLLFSTDQKGNQFAEVTRKDWVQIFLYFGWIISFNEFEKSIKKDKFVVSFIINFSNQCFSNGSLGSNCFSICFIIFAVLFFSLWFCWFLLFFRFVVMLFSFWFLRILFLLLSLSFFFNS